MSHFPLSPLCNLILLRCLLTLIFLSAVNLSLYFYHLHYNSRSLPHSLHIFLSHPHLFLFLVFSSLTCLLIFFKFFSFPRFPSNPLTLHPIFLSFSYFSSHPTFILINLLLSSFSFQHIIFLLPALISSFYTTLVALFLILSSSASSQFPAFQPSRPLILLSFPFKFSHPFSHLILLIFIFSSSIFLLSPSSHHYHNH